MVSLAGSLAVIACLLTLTAVRFTGCSLLIITRCECGQCCSRYCTTKEKNAGKVSYSKWDQAGDIMQLQQVSKPQLVEEGRQQLVRKVSRVSFQSRSQVSLVCLKKASCSENINADTSVYTFVNIV